VREKSVELRIQGLSYLEISETLGISKSTANVWTRNVKLSASAEKRLVDRGDAGRKKGVDSNRRKRIAKELLVVNEVEKLYRNIFFNRLDCKTHCALLYWCEGTKHESNSAVSYTNADPEMIRFFLSVFRKAFQIDEKKFRGLIHLHEYHDGEAQMQFWSGVTNIPIKQFNKPYLKSNTGKNKKENYQGCLNVKYYDKNVYNEIKNIIQKLITIQLRD